MRTPGGRRCLSLLLMTLVVLLVMLACCQLTAAVTTEDPPTTKSGTCPEVEYYLDDNACKNYNDSMQCDFDENCAGSKKCCVDACDGTTCTDPE